MVKKLRQGETISGTLAKDRLGIPTILFFVMSAAAPLTVVAGLLATAYAVTGEVGLPSSFVLVGLVLALFSVGYVTMSHHVPHTGALYAYISHGLGRPLGVGAAWMSLVAYCMLQVSLYGILGVAAAPFGITAPWWAVALPVWALVAVLGTTGVQISGRVLAALLVGEVGVIALLAAGDLTHPAQGLPWSTLSPTALLHPGVGAGLAIAFLGYVGFESAVVFVEEARQPRRTVRRATYWSIAAIAVLYGGSAWAMTTATGAAHILDEAAAQGSELVFTLAEAQFGAGVAMTARVFFATSVIAAMISFHNTFARYAFALGRERVLPAGFGTTAGNGAPRAASLAQSAIALAVIVLFAAAGWDPVVALFYTVSTSGAMGLLMVVFLAAVAVFAFFRQDAHGESRWRTHVAPTAAVVAVGVVLALVLMNFGTLLGAAPGSPLVWAMPLLFVTAAAAGAGYGLWLKAYGPATYAVIGMGAKSATATDPTLVAPVAQTAARATGGDR